MDAGISADLNPGTDTDGTTDTAAPAGTTAPGRQVNADGTITVSVSMTYDEDNRLMTYNGQTVEYDELGNMTRGPLNGGMADFTYDSRNRLVKVVEGDGTVTANEYDAENIRTAAITKGIRTECTTDRESTYSRTLVKTEYEKSVFGFYTEQKSQSIYTYGLGLTSERRDDREELYYHYNHLGSTVAVSDGNGDVIYRFVYDTYGELSDIRTKDGISLKDGTNPENREGLREAETTETEETTESAEAVQEITKDHTIAELAHAAGMEYLYNGQYGVATDRNGLYYMRARYYDQDIKRFINRDVVSGDLTNSQSLNRYCYVQGNPVSLTDPFGLCPDGNSSIDALTGSMMNSIEMMTGIRDGMESPNFYIHLILERLGHRWHVANIANDILYKIEAGDRDTISTCGHAVLSLAGIVWDGADIINALWYAAEGNHEMAAISAICAIPYIGSLVGGTAGLAIKFIGYGMTVGVGLKGTVEAVNRAVEAYENGTLSWWNALDIGLNVLTTGVAGAATYSTGKKLNWIIDLNNGGYVDWGYLRVVHLLDTIEQAINQLEEVIIYLEEIEVQGGQLI